MTAAVLNGTGTSKPQPLAAVRPAPSPLAGLAGPVGFALKTYAAGMLALYLSFWLGLDDPRWALLTAYIVSQPDSGMVLAKSFYRLLGTIAGLLVSIGLVFTVAQEGVLFLGAMALWIGLCNFASRATRDFASCHDSAKFRSFWCRAGHGGASIATAFRRSRGRSPHSAGTAMAVTDRPGREVGK